MNETVDGDTACRFCKRTQHRHIGRNLAKYLMSQLVGVYVANITENVLIHWHGGVYDEDAAWTDSLSDVNADLGKAGVKTDDAVRTVDVTLNSIGSSEMRP